MTFETPLYRALLHLNEKRGDFLSLNFGKSISEECQSFFIKLPSGASPEQVALNLRQCADEIEKYNPPA